MTWPRILSIYSTPLGRMQNRPRAVYRPRPDLATRPKSWVSETYRADSVPIVAISALWLYPDASNAETPRSAKPRQPRNGSHNSHQAPVCGQAASVVSDGSRSLLAATELATRLFFQARGWPLETGTISHLIIIIIKSQKIAHETLAAGAFKRARDNTGSESWPLNRTVPTWAA